MPVFVWNNGAFGRVNEKESSSDQIGPRAAKGFSNKGLEVIIRVIGSALCNCTHTSGVLLMGRGYTDKQESYGNCWCWGLLAYRVLYTRIFYALFACPNPLLYIIPYILSFHP